MEKKPNSGINLKEAWRYKGEKTGRPWKQRPWGTQAVQQSSKDYVVYVAEETVEGSKEVARCLYRAVPRYGGQPEESMKVLVPLSSKRAMKQPFPLESRNSDFNIPLLRGQWLPETRAGFVSVC